MDKQFNAEMLAALNEEPVSRKPDVQEDDLSIWYGPGGADGDCAWSVQRVSQGSWKVTEFQHVLDLIGDVDPNTPFLSVTCEVEAKDAGEAFRMGRVLLAYRGGDEEFVKNLPVA